MLFCSSKNLSKKTLKSYEQTLKLFAAYLKDQFQLEKVEGVAKSHFRQYVKFLQERGKYTVQVQVANNNPKSRNDFGKQITNNTINNYIRNLKVFFNWLSEEEEIEKNPATKVKLLKDNERLKPLLQEKEIADVLNSFDKSKFDGFRNYIITAFILDTGCRITECLSILVDDIDFNNKIVVIKNTKNKKERYVYFSQKMKRELKRWVQYKDRYIQSDLLFLSIRGNQLLIGTYETALRKIGKELGIELFPHRLRANFAQYYLLNGGDLLTLSRILGHSQLEVTKIYLQLDEKSISRQYQKFSPLNNLQI